MKPYRILKAQVHKLVKIMDERFRRIAMAMEKTNISMKNNTKL